MSTQGKRRAFAFTLDVIIAGLLATAILASIATSFRTGVAEFPEALELNALSRDALAVMDKQNVFESALSWNDSVAEAVLRNFLNDMLPAEYAANATVETYEYTTGASCSSACTLAGSAPVSSFCLCRRFAGSTAPATNVALVGSARRMFFIANGSSDRFGRADIRVWPR